MQSATRIAVVGEGVIGTSTALAIRRSLPNINLTIFSDRPFKDTSSFGPAGIFRFENSSERYRRWASKTFEFWSYLARQESPTETGVQLVSGHMQSDDREWLEKQERAFGEIVYNFRWLAPREIASVYAHPAKFAVHYTAYASEGRRYVPWLRGQLERLSGVNFQQRKINSLEELSAEKFSLIVNCAGLGGGKLAGDDDSVYPNRGVAIEIKAPGHLHFCYEGENTFCLPLVGDNVILGTVREDNRYGREISEQEKKEILERNFRLQPTLKNAQVMGEWCGLRPTRPKGVRLEHKLVDTKRNGVVHVIHNYGHASSGFVLSWGCAQEVLELIKSNRICEEDI